MDVDRLTAQSSRLPRFAALAALAIAVVDLLGWMTGLTVLTRVSSQWPVMLPWTALWIGGLALAVLLQTAPRPTRAGNWSGRLITLGLGLSAGIILVDSFVDAGWMDLWWFADQVLALDTPPQGRPALPTVISIVVLAVAVAMIRIEARWMGWAWLLFQTLVLPLPLLALAAYVFGAVEVVSASVADGMAFPTAASVLLVAIATMTARPDRPLMSWFRARPDQVTIRRTLLVLAGLPIAVWLARGAASTYLQNEGDQWAMGVLVGTVILAVQVFVISGRQQRELAAQLKAETQLRHARKAAEAAASAKATFLTNMSHEIRTPLTAVLGLLRLLRNTDQSRIQHDYTVRAERSARSLLAILNDILDYSKIEAHALDLERRPFDFDAMLTDLATILSTLVADKPVDLLFDLDPAMPGRVIGDRMRLEQVLLNVCGNAVKFTDAGHVLLTTRVRDSTTERVVVDVSVEDTGIGMTPESISRVTQSFAQADPGIARSYGGTGLGLAIASKLLAMMGSELTITSTVGKGSTFSFTISMEVPPETPRTTAKPPVPVHLSVLLVGGGTRLRALTTCMCRSFGWEVIEDESDQVLSRPTDVVIIDLPSGFEQDPNILQRLREASPRPSGGPDSWSGTALIALATQRIMGELTPDQADVLDGHVIKPVTASGLLEAIVTALHGTGTVRGVASSSPRLQGVRVLVVDDNDVTRSVVGEMLEHELAHVSCAISGEDAVNQVLAQPDQLDVVLMDEQMPGMDGLTATRQIRTHLEGRRLPILAMTANATTADRRACLDAGMNDHIAKPFNLDDLVARIRHWTNHGEPTQPETESPAALQLVEEQVLDTTSALARVGGNNDFYQRMLDRFGTSLSRHLADLDAARAQQDFAAIAAVAHTIRGAAATVGATGLAAVAADLESAAGRGAADDAEQAAHALRNSARVTTEAIQARSSAAGVSRPIEGVLERDR